MSSTTCLSFSRLIRSQEKNGVKMVEEELQMANEIYAALSELTSITARILRPAE